MLDFEDTPRQGIKSQSEEQANTPESESKVQAAADQDVQAQQDDNADTGKKTGLGLPSTDLPEAQPTEPMACSLEDPGCEACS